MWPRIPSQARDIASIVHPQTNLVRHLEEGPVVISRGQGIYVWDDCGKQFLDGAAGLWCASLGYASERLARVAYEQMRKLGYCASVSRHHQRAWRGSGGKAVADRAGADEQGAVPVLRFRGERHGDQAGLVLPRRDRQAEQAKDHRPQDGLSRQHVGRDQRVGQGGHACRFRPAVPGLPPHRISALLPPAPCRRERRAVRDAHGRCAGSDDHRGRSRDGAAASSPNR